MTSQDPAFEIRMIGQRIEELNAKKDQLTQAWDLETGSLGLVGTLSKQDSPLVQEIRETNRNLAFWYGQREAILKSHPKLQASMGASAPRKRSGPTHGSTQASRTAEDRHLRKRLIDVGFKAWCAAQRPQVKSSLESWENPEIRRRFEADKAAPPPANHGSESASPPESRATSASLASRPRDFREFLQEMGHPQAGWSDGRHEQLWVDDPDLRELHALWTEERLPKTETPA